MLESKNKKDYQDILRDILGNALFEELKEKTCIRGSTRDIRNRDRLSWLTDKNKKEYNLEYYLEVQQVGKWNRNDAEKIYCLFLKKDLKRQVYSIKYSENGSENGTNIEKDGTNIEQEMYGKITLSEFEELIREELKLTYYDSEFNSLIGKGRKQIILNGAPGTGKTYAARSYAEAKSGDRQFGFVQFHSSYDYTDFVEGLRPVGLNEKTSFVRLDGTFKKFCRYVVKENMKIFDEWLGEKKLNIKELLGDVPINNFEIYEMLEKMLEIKRKKDLKDGEVIEELTKYLQKKYLHVKEEDVQEEKIKELLMDYKKDKEKEIKFPDYYFIIDEINRADLSKVLGELMFSLEEDKRGVLNRISTQYCNMSTYEIENGEAKKIENDYFKDGFFIPENIIVIGTMNDIDRSVESFDFALKRRFYWREIEVDKVCGDIFTGMGIKDKALEDALGKLNSYIAGDAGKKFNLNKHYQIGPAYFKGYASKTEDSEGLTIEEIWEYRIKNLLEGYCVGRDAEKFIRQCRAKLMGENDNENKDGE